MKEEGEKDIRIVQWKLSPSSLQFNNHFLSFSWCKGSL